MDMENRLYSIEQRLETIEGEYATRLAVMEKKLDSIEESIKTLIVAGQTLKWVAIIMGGLYVFLKTGDPSEFLRGFKGP